MYSSKRQRARAQGTKLVSLVGVRLLSGSGFVSGKLLKLFIIISEKIGWITSEGAKVRRCEDAKVGWSVDRRGDRRAKTGRDQR